VVGLDGKNFGVALEVKSGAPDVQRNHLFREVKVTVPEGGNQHVVLAMYDTEIFGVDQHRVGPAVGLCCVPQACAEFSQQVCGDALVHSQMELAIELKELLDVTGVLHPFR
jgi:hypothetical protein